MILDRFRNRTPSDLKSDEKALAEALREAGATITGRSVRCPFCGDKKPSAGIYQPNGDGFRLKCHSCGFNGSVLDVIAKADGLEIGEVFKRLGGGSRPKQKIATVYPHFSALMAALPYPVDTVYKYVHPDTNAVEMIVVRMLKPDGDKELRQARPEGSGFVLKAPAKPWSLYNRAGIRDADTVVVVEGEKCCDALGRYSIVATTSPAGAGKAEHADWTPLRGKNAVLWADNDLVGHNHMKQIEGILQRLEPAPRISVLEPADVALGAKEDAADLILQLEVLHTDGEKIKTEILEALAKSKSRGIAAGVGEMIEDMIAGRRQAIRWPWDCVGGLSKALLPGTLTLICGNVGASKSFMLLHAAAFWGECGVKTAVYELEEDKDFHLSRCLAQKSGTAGLTDPDWIKKNPDEARALFARHEGWLENFGSCIYACPDEQPTLPSLAEWVQARAKAGCRVIAIDPVTLASHTGRMTWEEDGKFLHDVKKAAVDHGCSIVLVTHPIKSSSHVDVTQLAGGAAYQRFAQTILWLESHGDKASTVKMACGTTTVKHNRSLHILKARNGRGQGLRLAFQFQAAGLTLKEIGLIVKRGKKQETADSESEKVDEKKQESSEVAAEAGRKGLW